MNRIFAIIIMTLSYATGLQAATVYNVTSNTSASSILPSYCGSCTINISSGVTLTLNNSIYCSACSFSGGTVKVTSSSSFENTSFSNTVINATHNFTVNNSGSSFNNVTLTISGSAGFTLNNSFSMSNSTLTFKNTASFISNGQLNLDNSIMYFNDNTTFLSNSSTVNLKNGSKIVAGDGSKTSKAHLTFYGTLNLVDASSYMILSNVNNYYSSWNNYTSASNGKSYNTTSNYQPDYYGAAVFSSSGPLPITVLATTIGDLNGYVNNNNAVKISWTLSDATGGEYFRVERSSDAEHFTELTTIPSDQLSGSYTYTDLSPLAGENDYRIKLIAKDGTISYSKIISEQITTTGSLHIFPNPCTNGNIQIQFPSVQSAMINVFTADGKLLYMKSISGQSLYAINIPDAANSHLLVMQIITKGKTSAFTLISNP
ncbi:MAG: hypothetical protein Q8918_15500 [Bacteroidota bacterium]|nr:hypothetical protein [Bacteroidota bacterium]